MNASFFIGFNILILLLLCIDLFVFNRRNHVVRMREAVAWSVFWIALALAFNYLLYVFAGKALALEFMTAYLLEKSLSVDNLFVFVLLFSSFAVPPAYRHKVLFWGVIGAIVMRGFFIFAGLSLVEYFHASFYLLGAFLIYGAIKSLSQEEDGVDWQNSRWYKVLRRFVPLVPEYHQDNFWIREKGKLLFTPLFVALVSIEISDLVFAADSIPAILSISTNPFIVYTSNIFAILGLRALYFVLEGTLHHFHLLKYGLAAILVFVGLKMLLIDLIHIEVIYSLIFIFTVLLSAALLSFLVPKPKQKEKVSNTMVK